MTTYQGSCHCGQTSFEVDGEIKGAMAAVNIRCLDGVDLDAVPVQHYDGLSM